MASNTYPAGAQNPPVDVRCCVRARCDWAKPWGPIKLLKEIDKAQGKNNQHIQEKVKKGDASPFQTRKQAAQDAGLSPEWANLPKLLGFRWRDNLTVMSEQHRFRCPEFLCCFACPMKREQMRCSRMSETVPWPIINSRLGFNCIHAPTTVNRHRQRLGPISPQPCDRRSFHLNNSTRPGLCHLPKDTERLPCEVYITPLKARDLVGSNPNEKTHCQFRDSPRVDFHCGVQ